jgi:hypothetical protein
MSLLLVLALTAAAWALAFGATWAIVMAFASGGM